MIGAPEGRKPGLGRLGIALWATIAVILATPLVAMQFTREVAWTAFDFAVAAGLLVGAALAFEVAVRVTPRTAWRLAVGAALVAAVAVIWAQGAVGVF